MLFYIENFAISFFGTAAFALFYQSPKKIIWMCGVAGAVGWCTYIYTINIFNNSFGANLLASIALTVVSGVFAVIAKKPMPAFVSTALLPIVPGVKLYQGMYCLFVEHGKYAEGMKKLMGAGSDSIAIALGIMVGVSIFQLIRGRQLRALSKR